MAISIGIGGNVQKKRNTPPSIDGIESQLEGAGFGYVIPYEKDTIQEAKKAIEGTQDYLALSGNIDIVYLPKITSDKTNLLGIFSKCYSLKSVYLEINALNLNLMFSKCYSLEYVKIEYTNNVVVSAQDLFNGCSSLSTVDIINKSGPLKISNASRMFLDCWSLKAIPSSLDFSECITVDRMLDNTVCLKTLEIDLGKVASDFRWGSSTYTIGLENLTIPSGISPSVASVAIYSPYLTKESLHNIAVAVYDRVGVTPVGALTISMGSLNRMAQEDIDLMASKNWSVQGI